MGFTPLWRNWNSPRWLKWLTTVVVAELAWFALLHPLVPRTIVAGVVEALLLLPAVAYLYVFEGIATQPLGLESRPARGQKLKLYALGLGWLALVIAEVYAAVHYLSGQWRIGLFGHCRAI
jgi:hypothetical protein